MSDQVTAAQLRAEAAQASAIAAELRRQAVVVARAERAAKRPPAPHVDTDNPRFVTFGRYQSGRSYSYAAVGWCVGDHVRWAVTGAETRQFNWPGLLDFIGEANWETVHVVTDRVRLLPDAELPPAAETVGRYGTRTASKSTGVSVDERSFVDRSRWADDDNPFDPYLGG